MSAACPPLENTLYLIISDYLDIKNILFTFFLLSGKVDDLISCAFVHFDPIMFSTDSFQKGDLILIINMNIDLPLKANAIILIYSHCSEKFCR